MEESPIPPQRVVVVGVDGSPSSIAALQLAARLIPLMGDVVHAVTAWQNPVAFGLYAPMEGDYEQLADRILDEALADAFHDEVPRGIERRILRGSPAEILIGESKHASMVVVGSRGHGGFTGLLLGSVSSAVAERAQCPVLVSHGALQFPQGEVMALPPVGVSA